MLRIGVLATMAGLATSLPLSAALSDLWDPRAAADRVMSAKVTAVPPLLVQRAQHVAERMNLQGRENLFVVVGSSLSAMSIGSAWVGKGLGIVLPRNINVKSIDDPLFDELTIASSIQASTTPSSSNTNQNPDSSSSSSDYYPTSVDSLTAASSQEISLKDQLKPLLVSSDQVVDFRIAHEVAHLKNEDSLRKAILHPGSVLIGFVSWVKLFGGLSRSSQIATAIGLGGFFLFGNILYLRNLEFDADKMAAKAGYREGGIAFFENQLKLNQILYAQPGGDKYYDKQGNDLRRWSHPTLTERLDKMRQY